MEQKLKQADLTIEDQELILSHALEKIKQGKMKNLDPTLGDQGCHMRTFPLIYIAGKVLNSQELTEEEKKFLISLETTVANSVDINAQNGFFLLNRSGKKHIPPYLRTKYSISKRTDIISRYRKQAADMSRAFLAQKVAELPETEMFKELKASFLNDIKNVVRDKETLTVTPFYSTFTLILEILLKEGLPVVLIVQEYQLLEGGKAINLFKATPLFYEPNSERTEFQLIRAPDSSKPAFCVQIFTLYEPEKRKASLEDLVARIQASNFIKVISAMMTQHDEYPPHISEEDKLSSYEKSENQGLLRKEYESSIQLAEIMNVTSGRLNWRINDFESELTKDEIFQMTHAYCSDYKTEAKECELLNREEMLSTRVIFNHDQQKTTYKNLD